MEDSKIFILEAPTILSVNERKFWLLTVSANPLDNNELNSAAKPRKRGLIFSVKLLKCFPKIRNWLSNRRIYE